MGSTPVASSKKVPEVRFVASFKKCLNCQVTRTLTTLGDVLFYDPFPVSKNAGSGGT